MWGCFWLTESGVGLGRESEIPEMLNKPRSIFRWPLHGGVTGVMKSETTASHELHDASLHHHLPLPLPSPPSEPCRSSFLGNPIFVTLPCKFRFSSRKSHGSTPMFAFTHGLRPQPHPSPPTVGETYSQYIHRFLDINAEPLSVPIPHTILQPTPPSTSATPPMPGCIGTTQAP